MRGERSMVRAPLASLRPPHSSPPQLLRPPCTLYPVPCTLYPVPCTAAPPAAAATAESGVPASSPPSPSAAMVSEIDAEIAWQREAEVMLLITEEVAYSAQRTGHRA